MYDKLYRIMNWPLIEGIEFTDIDNPHDLLGAHKTDLGTLIQGFIPGADSAKVKINNKEIDMFKMDEAGFFASLTDEDVSEYSIEATYGEVKKEYIDPYSYAVGSEIDKLKKLNAGILYETCDIMGAHAETIGKVTGVRFRVWAPFALRVSVIGEFNNWDGRIHQMSRVAETGIFEIFIPGLKVGEMYKYEIKKKGNENLIKSDPYSYQCEKIPGNASVVFDLDEYKWNDKEWMETRESKNKESYPINIYELNVGTFSRNDEGEVNYKDLAVDIAKYVKDMGYTHIEIMPISEYGNDLSLGYETNNFYAPTSRYGTPKEFMEFIDYIHGQGIGIILDIAYNQFESDESGLRAFDGSCLYEHMDSIKGINPRNGACLFNYGRPEVTSYLLGSAFMWLNKYHMDGLKLVNTASMIYLDYDRNSGEWIPNIYGGNENLEAIEFIKHFNSIIHKKLKGVITIAHDNSGFPMMTGEVSEECLGFDLKINEEWRKDILKYLSIPPYLREAKYNDLSLSMVYQYSDDFIVGYPEMEFINGQSSLIGRMTGDTEERKFANMRLALSYMMVHPGKKLLFMGQDIAQYNEWLSAGTVDFSILNVDKHRNINNCVKALNKMYFEEPALYELDNDSEGFEWINNISSRESILTFARKGLSYNNGELKDEDMLVVICNFDAVDREDYKIGVPKKGKYKEIFNSDSAEFGGNGFTNTRLKQSKTDECDGREESIRINVPALSIVVLKFSKVDKKLVDNKTAKENAKSSSKDISKTTAKKAVTKKTATTKAATVKKTAATKAATAKETTATKAATAKKTTTTKAATAKETAATKAATAKKAAATKVTAKESTAKKAVTKKTAATKAATAKESTIKNTIK